MKNKYTFKSKIAFALLAFLGFQHNVMAQITINVSEDTYVEGTSTNSSVNFGGAAEGRARDTTTSAPRIAYYKFPVASSLPSSVTCANLKVFLYAPTTDPALKPSEFIQVHKLPSTWSENVVTYDTKPTTGAFIREINVQTKPTPVVTNAYTAYFVDVTAYVNEVLAAGGTDISFALKAKPADAGGAGILVRTGTKENTTQPVTATLELNCTLGVDDIGNNQSPLKVYPNPTKSSFTLNSTFNSSDVLEISVFNLLGAKVASFKESVHPGIWKKEYTAQELNMTTGMYLLKVSSINGSSVSKIVVE